MPKRAGPRSRISFLPLLLPYNSSSLDVPSSPVLYYTIAIKSAQKNLVCFSSSLHPLLTRPSVVSGNDRETSLEAPFSQGKDAQGRTDLLPSWPSEALPQERPQPGGSGKDLHHDPKHTPGAVFRAECVENTVCVFDEAVGYKRSSRETAGAAPSQ